MDKLKEFIQSEITIAHDQIIARAVKVFGESELSEEDYDDLFNVDMDGNVIYGYDMEEMQNHAYDLGRYKTLNEILNHIK